MIMVINSDVNFVQRDTIFFIQVGTIANRRYTLAQWSTQTDAAAIRYQTLLPNCCGRLGGCNFVLVNLWYT